MVLGVNAIDPKIVVIGDIAAIIILSQAELPDAVAEKAPLVCPLTLGIGDAAVCHVGTKLGIPQTRHVRAHAAAVLGIGNFRPLFAKFPLTAPDLGVLGVGVGALFVPVGDKLRQRLARGVALGQRKLGRHIDELMPLAAGDELKLQKLEKRKICGGAFGLGDELGVLIGRKRRAAAGAGDECLNGRCDHAFGLGAAEDHHIHRAVGGVGKALGQDIFTPESFEEMHKAVLVILRCVNGKFAAVKAYRIAARDGIVRRNEPCSAERFHALRSVIKA